MLPFLPLYYLGNHSDEVGRGLLVVQRGPSLEAEYTTVAVHRKLGGVRIL